MPHRNPSAGELSLWLKQYEDLNSDLDKSVRRQFFMFAAAPACRPAVLDELFGRPLGKTPRRHRSFFWYNSMISSGLDRYWDKLAADKNSGTPLSECLRWLRRKATAGEWRTLSRRHGGGIFRDSLLIIPSTYSREPNTKFFWSKGGTWNSGSSITKIVCKGEHLTRDHSFNTITRKLTPEQCRKLESEVHNVVDENSLLQPDALDAAVLYVRNRVRELIGWKPGPTHPKNVSWFFQEAIPFNHLWYDWSSRRPNWGEHDEPYHWFPMDAPWIK